MNNEADLVSAIMLEFTSRRLPHHKMHGSMYQSGFPDLFVASPQGFYVCEAKYLHQQKPTLLQLWQALRPLQRKNCCQYAAVGAPASIAAYTKIGLVLVPHTDFPKVLEWPKPLPLDPWVKPSVAALVDGILYLD